MNTSLLFDQFDLLLDAPDTVQKMRELILQLAVEGKLVPQHPNDEPAEKLLNRLKRAQQKIIDEGKAKLTRKHQDLGKANDFFDTPKSWKWEFLAFVPLWPLKDGDWVESKDQNPNGDVRLIQLADVGNREYRNRSVRFMTSDKAKKMNCTYLQNGDVLIARLPDPLGRACIFPGDIKPCVTVVDVAICRCDSKFIDNRYLIIALNSLTIRNKIAEYATGTTRTRVSTGNLSRIQIPIAPLEEQKRIVAKVDQLMKLCDELEKLQNRAYKENIQLNNSALDCVMSARDNGDFQKRWGFVSDNFDLLHSVPENITKLRQTILQLAVQGKLVPQDPNDEPASELLKRIKLAKEKLIRDKLIRKDKLKLDYSEIDNSYLPEGWSSAYMQDITSVITCGIASTPKYFDQGRIFLSARNVKPYSFMPENHKFVNEETYRKIVSWGAKPELGDILLTRVGAGIGEAALIDKVVDFAYYVSLTLIKPIQPFINSSYLLHWINSPEGVNKALENIYGRGVSQGNLNVNQVRKFVVPIPPLKEQKRIVAKVDQLMKLCDDLESQLQQSQKDSEMLMQAVLRETVGTN
jgi:type I restriction enzyme S subunit